MKLIEAFLTILLRFEVFWAPVALVKFHSQDGHEYQKQKDVRIFEGITDSLFLLNIFRVIYTTAAKYKDQSATKPKFRPIEFVIPVLDFIAIVIRLICIGLNKFVPLKSLALLLRIPYMISHSNPQYIIYDFPNVAALLQR